MINGAIKECIDNITLCTCIFNVRYSVDFTFI
jgi:hypothetical protein